MVVLSNIYFAVASASASSHRHCAHCFGSWNRKRGTRSYRDLLETHNILSSIFKFWKGKTIDLHPLEVPKNHFQFLRKCKV